MLACALATSGCKERAHPPNAPTPQAEAAPSPAAPRLVVLVVIDQLASWMFERDAALTRAGVRRLIDRGTVFPRARYPYASTYTATGHAALGTGAPPSESGILANEWYRRDRGRVVSAIADPASPVFRVTGTPGDAGLSGAQLRVEGVADVLRREKGGKSIAIALKARGAILALGRRPDYAIWYDADQPAMTTSAYYAAELPGWLREVARTHPVARLAEASWTPSDPDLLARATGVPDTCPGEGGPYGLGSAFPHRPAASRKPARAVRATPAGNRLTLATAVAAIDGHQLGADDVPDVLAVSFSSHDYAGHAWGQESWERLDLFLDTDRAIGALLDHLDARVGAGRYAVILTSDHGATRLVEHSLHHGKPARRVMTSEVRAAARAAAEAALGSGSWVANVSTANIYMSAAFAALPDRDRARALDAIVVAVAGVPEVAYAARADQLQGGCAERSGLAAQACWSLRGADSGDVFFAAGPDSVCTTDEYTTGTSHGSPNPDDTDVPIVLYVPGKAPRTATEAASPLQVAPTISELLGVSAPSHARALPLR